MAVGVFAGDGFPVGGVVRVETAGFGVHFFFEEAEELAEALFEGGFGPDLDEAGEGFEKVEVGIERTEASEGGCPAFFASDFGVVIVAVGGSVGVEGFEIAFVYGVVGVVVVPGEGADGEGESVVVVEDAGHFGQGIDGEGDAVAVFFFLTAGVGPAVEVDTPEEASLVVIPLVFFEPGEAVFSDFLEVVVEVGEEVGAGGGDPDGAGLEDEGAGIVGELGPVVVEVFVESAAFVGDAGEDGFDGVFDQDFGGLFADLEESDGEFGHGRFED